jgi:hypothetical protein
VERSLSESQAVTAAQGSVPLIGIVAGGAGGLVIVIVVVVAVFLCRRGEGQDSGLIDDDDELEGEPTLPTDSWNVPGTIAAGHQYENPLAETVIGNQDELDE